MAVLASDAVLNREIFAQVDGQRPDCASLYSPAFFAQVLPDHYSINGAEFPYDTVLNNRSTASPSNFSAYMGEFERLGLPAGPGTQRVRPRSPL